MDIQYKPSKPKKEKPVKVPKAPKAEKAMKFTSTVQTVKPAKPAKAPKAPKPEKAKKMTFGKPGKVQMDKPVKVEKPKKPGIFSKIDPKWILGGAVVLIAAIAVVVLTVVLPGIENHGQQIQKIEITKTPTQFLYELNEEANYDGMRITVTRNNGETFTVRANKCQITGFDTTTPAEKRVVTVSYEGFSDTFEITVVDNTPKPAINRIFLDPEPPRTYVWGEGLVDIVGVYIWAEYVDGTTGKLKELSNTDISGFAEITGPGTYWLTVGYDDDGDWLTHSYPITVKAPVTG